MKNSRLLITGGTGSFGHQVLQGFLNTEIEEIIIFSRDESKQDLMRRRFDSKKVKYFIGDIRDSNALSDALVDVDFVFHAAALKQVPSCEFFPLEAVKTNILGTANLLDVAVRQGVKKVICLSTDKAAYPVNAMGISKAMMEKVAIAKAREFRDSGTSIAVTRYGNVLNSRGSVVPLFLEKIHRNESLPITDGSMTRFLMTLPEALDLVMFAFSNLKGGEIFIQKSPATKIEILAEAIKKIFSYTKENKYIGVRHGEKMYEVLMTKEERLASEDFGNFYSIKPDFRDLNYEKYLTVGDKEINNMDEYNSNNTFQLDVDGVINKLLEVDEIKDLLKC